MKQWGKRVVQVVLGAFLGSLLLENLTRFSIWTFMPIVHDVQFALFITIISILGGIFGGISMAAFLATKGGRFKPAGWLLLVSGVLGLVLSVPDIKMATQIFVQNGHPFIDAWAYFGFSMLWSVALIVWGMLLLLKRLPKYQAV